MIRKTSIETYKAIKESGALSNKKMMVYEYLYNNGPLTGGELQVALGGSGVSESIRNRITELVRAGVVYEVKETICPITGRKVMLFDVTNKMPEKYENPKTKSEIINELRQDNEILSLEIKEMEESLFYIVNKYLEETDKELYDLPRFITKWFPDQKEVEGSL